MNLRKSLAKKLKKTGGFTLVEMLIVVAIIAILVAVSIPMVTSSLEKAREATDAANLRAAKMVAMFSAAEGKLNGDETDITGGATPYYYDVDAGQLVADADDLGDNSKKQSSEKKGSIITVTFEADTLEPKVEWATAPAAGG